MPNPSELARIEQEQELAQFRDDLKSYRYRDKNTKECILRAIRNLEAALGIESKPYNSQSF